MFFYHQIMIIVCRKSSFFFIGVFFLNILTLASALRNYDGRQNEHDSINTGEGAKFDLGSSRPNKQVCSENYVKRVFSCLTTLLLFIIFRSCSNVCTLTQRVHTNAYSFLLDASTEEACKIIQSKLEDALPKKNP